MEAKTTWDRLITFSQAAQQYINRVASCVKCGARINVDDKFCSTCGAEIVEKPTPKQSKLGYALEKMIKRVGAMNNDLQESLGDITDSTWAADEKGVLLTDAQGKFQMTKEGLKERKDRNKKLVKETDIVFEPYFATQLPDDLTIDEVEAFKGIVIKDAEADALLAKLDTADELSA